MKGLVVVVLLLAVAAGEEWYDRGWVDCYELLEVEPYTSEVADIARAVRRITSKTHPDRCNTTECASKFAQANNCKETLSDPLTRRTYDERHKNPIYITTSGAPPKFVAVVVILVLVFLFTYVQYRSVEARYRTAHDIELAALVRRQKDTPQVRAELLHDYRLDSKMAIIQDLWFPQLGLLLLASIKSVFVSSSASSSSSSSSSASATSSSSGSSSSGRPAPRSRPLDPATTATKALMAQGVRLVITFGIIWFAWYAGTKLTGSHAPLYVVREDMGGFERGDLLLMEWGRHVMESLSAGDVIAYRQMYEDPYFTLSRVTAIHKEASRGKRVVGGDIWINTKQDNSKRDDRQRRLSDSSDMYFDARDPSYPGRVYYRLPFLGMPGLLFGDTSVFIYLVVFMWCVYALIQAGQATKKARLAARTASIARARKSPNPNSKTE